MIKKINPRAELISLMRGFFVCPIISFLHNHKLVDKIIKSDFNSQSFRAIKNKLFFEKILFYLVSLGLLNIKKKKNTRNKLFYATKLGKKIFSRSGSFLLLHSYKPFINELEKNLIKKKTSLIFCNRSENVAGSGSTNNKKFFPSAIDLVKKENIGLIADIGCGNGNFISQISKKFPLVPIFASDLSNMAIGASKKRLGANSSIRKIKYLICNAANVKKWANEINKIKIKKNSKILISAWYILHEISKHERQNIIRFFKNIKKYIPNAIILIGEITKIENHVMALNKDVSIMPEFLFFHELSGQGVLKFSDYDHILKKIPYRLSKHIKFDLIRHNKKTIPSAFVWLLKNK